MEEQLFLVWSQKHGMWWGPGGCGYTNDMTKAGRYNERQADGCVRQSNYQGFFGSVKVPAPELPEGATYDA